MPPLITFITKSWISESNFNENINEYELESYILYNTKRNRSQGGGLLLYIKSSLNSSLNYNIKENNELNTLWVDIKLSKILNIRAGSFFRSPNQSYEDDLCMIK